MRGQIKNFPLGYWPHGWLLAGPRLLLTNTLGSLSPLCPAHLHSPPLSSLVISLLPMVSMPPQPPKAGHVSVLFTLYISTKFTFLNMPSWVPTLPSKTPWSWRSEFTLLCMLDTASTTSAPPRSWAQPGYTTCPSLVTTHPLTHSRHLLHQEHLHPQRQLSAVPAPALPDLPP